MLYSLLVGLVVGFLAKWIMPGRDPGDGKGFVGILITIVIGLGGGWLGGFILGLIGIGVTGFIGPIISGVIGALLLLYIYRLVMKKRKR